MIAANILLVLGQCLVIYIFFHYFYLYDRRQRKLVNSTPGPKTVPILGNLLDLNVSLVKVYELIRDWSKQYYPVYRLWFGVTPIIRIQHPDDLEIIFSSQKHITKALDDTSFNSWLGTGLLVSTGSLWHRRRKILTPAFHFNILNKYMEITNEQSKNLISDIAGKGSEVKIDLLPFFSKYTINIICETAMGVSVSKENKEETNKYKEAVNKLGQIILYRFVRPYILDWMLYAMSEMKKENDAALKTIKEFTDKIVKERREYNSNSKIQNLEHLNRDEGKNNYTEQNTGRRRLAMLDLLLASEDNKLIDDAGIRDEVSNFIFAGHDTTALSMCYSVMLLAENKTAQDLARKEVEAILDQKNGNLDTSDLREMNYLERCIKETLRLYPPAPSITRLITEDLQLKNCFVPKGVTLVVDIIDANNDPHFWPEPQKFDPDRFLPEESRKRHPFSYVPFSAGPRNCIGQKFAIMELKSLLALILYNFELEPVDYLKDVKLQADLVLRPSHPIHAKFIKINRS